jgi:hypothetical protein
MKGDKVPGLYLSLGTIFTKMYVVFPKSPQTNADATNHVLTIHRRISSALLTRQAVS